MTQHHHWHPTWYKKEHGLDWERVKEAFRRDWQQTRHDAHLGGHELNQKMGDTMKQAAGKETIPVDQRANPPKVIGELGDWETVEHPLEYGYVARKQYGSAHDQWDDDLEADLRREWESSDAKPVHRWDEVRTYVRRGYDYKS